MPFDPENAFDPTDPSQWARALPRIVVHPNPAPDAPPPDGIDDWFVPGQVDDGPDDWFVPPPAATPSLGQPAPGAQPAPVNPAIHRYYGANATSRSEPEK